MKEMFYTQAQLDHQQRVLQRKKRQLLICTAGWLLLTAAVCLLLTRDNQWICTWINGLGSGAYFCWLMYFVTYDYRKEREYARLIQEVLNGRKKTVAGVLGAFETKNNALETEDLLFFEPDDPQEKHRMYRLTGRAGVHPQQLMGVHLVLYAYQDQVAGIEVTQ